METYVLAVKRDRRREGTTTSVVDSFPGLSVVSRSNEFIVSIRAEKAAIDAFRKQHGGDFLIEKSMHRSLPEPRPGMAVG